ncbi:MAG: Crp/Fnr family transcriptional regulator [Flavobacteriales bacterium]|nr:Crp/Fnr family transcriptional regulator [Flavobacteriales bacterium]MCB9181330.1 Crp/Fnr family transcriptional regulator [Flavobacteriales bacterium]MCB9200800.1 Crp/Fnr family transcriptional regulator [Flavobacteriales bacterium]
MSVNIELVRQHFPQLREEELIEAIAAVGEVKEVKAGDLLIDTGDWVRQLPLLLSGSIKVFRDDEEGGELFLYHLHAGEACAMTLTCCLAQEQSEVRAIAEEDTEFIAIPVRYMDEWMPKYKSWRELVMQTYRMRFEELLGAIDLIAFKKLDDRLLHYLQAKVRATGNQTLSMTHQQIADEMHTAREVVSRLLKQMERRGLVRSGRNRIELVEAQVPE